MHPASAREQSRALLARHPDEDGLRRDPAFQGLLRAKKAAFSRALMRMHLASQPAGSQIVVGPALPLGLSGPGVHCGVEPREEADEEQVQVLTTEELTRRLIALERTIAVQHTELSGKIAAQNQKFDELGA